MRAMIDRAFQPEHYFAALKLLEQLHNINEGQDVPESVIEAFVVKIVVSKGGFDWYLRFDGDPDKPLHCQLQGKCKTNTKIMVAGDISPTMDNSATGCY